MPESLSSDGKTVRPFSSLLRVLGSPVIVFYTFPWLMLLLTLGTIAQKEDGLFAAQRDYFSAWVFWLGPVPLPGAYLTIGLITLSLLVKFVFFSEWRGRKAGTILSHLGVLVLLIGGMVTAVSQKEGFIVLGEEQSVSSVSDYHRRVINIERDGRPFATIPFESALKNETLPLPQLPFSVRVLETCTNCRPAPVKNPDGRHGLAASVDLFPAPPEKENEANLSGMVFAVAGAGSGQDGTYAIMEEIPHRPEIKTDKGVYRVGIARAQRPLPFTLTLKDFRREVYPGTDMARGFSSDVIIESGGAAWPYKISMNEPLRYKGHTLYQSSFSVRPDGEYSVFSVVENKGRVFPYIASALIFAGLLLHVVIRLYRKGVA